MSEAGESLDGRQTAAIWALLANVVEERPYGPGGIETRRGVKIFPPGAKVHVVGGFGGMGYETVTVVGVSRSHKTVTAHLDIGYLTNWRVRLVYSPALRRRIEAAWLNPHGGFRVPQPDDLGGQEHRDALEGLARVFGERTRRLRTERLARQALFRKAAQVSVCRIGCTAELWDLVIPPAGDMANKLAKEGVIARTGRTVTLELSGHQLVELLTELPLDTGFPWTPRSRPGRLADAVVAALDLVPRVLREAELVLDIVVNGAETAEPAGAHTL